MSMTSTAPEERGDDRGEVLRPAAYIKAARGHLQSGELKKAYGVMLQALLHYPDNALILSYYGCLQAIVDKKYRSGIESCRKALVLFKAADTYTAGIVYPILYLNLGRAYVAAGKKKEAVEALSKGLRYDKGNRELKKELLLLGVRKRPVVPFLSRSNPINKYIGMVLHGQQKDAKPRSGH
jgi:tetratricopeptide (TPR) repeat protein